MPDHIWIWQRIVSPHMAGLAAALARRGIEVTYVAERPLSEERRAQGWQVPEAGMARILFAPSTNDISRLVQEIPSSSIHICQGFRGNGIIGVARRALAERSLRQWVVMETIDDAGWWGVLKRLEYRRLIHRWREAVQGVLAIGKTTTPWLTQRGMPAERVYPFGYFLSDDVTWRAVGTTGTDSLRLLFVGRLVALKQVDLLITALAPLMGTRFELVVVGAGPLESDLRVKAEKLLGQRMIWLGMRPQGEISDIMATADCLVLPSRYDGWGAVVSEALMAGTPAICSDRCGAADVVTASGVGGVFSTGDRASLTKLLSHVIGNGKQSDESRLTLSSWAKCLGSTAGADYLLDILRHSSGTGRRPVVPWNRSEVRKLVRTASLR